MWDFIREWLPIIAFVSGTGLGWLINALFESVRRNQLEELYQNTSNSNMALESQLKSKSKLEEDLGRTNSELEKLRAEVSSLSIPNKIASTLDLENKTLREKIKKLKSKPVVKTNSGDQNHVTEYQLFLSDLEKSIKQAKKKVKHKNVIKANKQEKNKKRKHKKTKIAKNSKKKKKAKSNAKFDFYKQKYSSAKPSSVPIDKTAENKDLTYLHGISGDIQEILNENGILSFSDLSSTKIAELRAFLTLAGEKYENVDPLNWPIQARIADKGQWEILDEYKSKMEM